MAEDANIIDALQTLQTTLETYDPAFSLDRSEELTPELFDAAQNFIERLSGIENVAVTLNQGENPVQGIYDLIVGETLSGFFESDAFTSIKEDIEAGDLTAASRSLRAIAAPGHFVDNPELLLQFISDGENGLAPFVAALNTLEESGELSERPAVYTEEQLAKQPEAIEAIETQIQEDLPYFIGVLETALEGAKQAKRDLDEEATDAQREAAQNRIDSIRTSLESMKASNEAIKDLEPGGENFDEAFRGALTSYVSFLQERNFYSMYITADIGERAPIPEDYVSTNGQYTEAYEEFLIARRESFQDYFEELEAKGDERDVEEESAYNTLVNINRFTTNMALLVESGLYVQPEGEPAAPETIPVDEARPIIEEAIDYMVRNDKVEVRPLQRDADNGEFDLASRMAIQAFIIDLKNELDIDVQRGSGVYTEAFRDALEIKLQDAATQKRVADLYFRGDLNMVTNLMVALNTYETDEDVANLPGAFKANIGSDALISMPQLKDIEVRQIDTAIDRIPADEMAGMNEMMITLTGYGMEDFMPEGTLTEDQLRALEHDGQSRADVLGDYFTKIEAEARAALERDGRQMSELEGEIQERMVERFNNLVEGNAAFNVVRAEYMRNAIEDSVSAALEAKNTIEGSPQVQQNAAEVTFADNMPTAEEFLQEHGANRRSYFVYDKDDMEGVTPEVLQGFAGQVERQDATLEQALSGQTIGQLIDDMTEDFERLDSSPIAQRTISEVRANLAETENMLGRVYNDPRHGDHIDENGHMVVTDRNGETILISQGESGLEFRYLDAAGIENLSDFGAEVYNLGEELDTDKLLITTAMAGYQSVNQGVDWTENHNPEFFEMGGKQYVVGIDKDTSTIQVHALNEEVHTSSMAASIAYATTPERRQAVRDELMEDSAYGFVRGEYGNVFSSADSVDRVFEFMTRQYARAGSVDADTALNILSEATRIDWDNVRHLSDAPEVNDEMTLGRVQLMVRERANEGLTEPFIYLKHGIEPQILVVTPALNVETATDDAGNEVTFSTIDLEQRPHVLDISDPADYEWMREVFMGHDVINQAAIDDPEFQALHDWMNSGGRPPLIKPPEMVEYGPATEEGLASMFESAAGFKSEGRDLTLGTPITETEALVEVLGYDPNAAFVQNRFEGMQGTYVVHGIEPAIWEGSEDHHEFLKDHILVTYERNDEVVTIAIDKEDIAYNPMRIPLLLELEHGFEGMGQPTVFAADRDRIETTDEGLYVPVHNFIDIARGDMPVIRDGFWDNQEYWEKTNAWRIDANALRDSIEEEEAATRTVPGPFHAALDENRADITAPPAHLNFNEDGRPMDAAAALARPVN